jgi:two-component system, LytTR family, sensor kinase
MGSGPLRSQTVHCSRMVVDCIGGTCVRLGEYDSSMNSTPLNTRPGYWPWIALIWVGIGLIDACETVFPMRAQGMHHAWVSLFATRMLAWLPWALATPLVVRIGRNYPPGRARGLPTWALHVSAALTLGVVSAAWNAALEMLLNPWLNDPPPNHFAALWLTEFFYSGLLTALVLYAFILAIDFALQSRQRLARQQTDAARLSEQLSKAQLEALRRQIEPHFVFNALNAIAALVRDNRNDAAVDMIVALSEFLRHAAEESTRPQVPLAQEVEHLRRYLEIQKARFADRLQVTLDIPPELLSAQVPSLILQPLVENAIKHGIAKRARGGQIQVAATRADGVLSIHVGNDGPSLPPDFETKRTGIGIVNLRNRLQILYGTGFELALRNQAAGGVQVSISLPLAGA